MGRMGIALARSYPHWASSPSASRSCGSETVRRAAAAPRYGGDVAATLRPDPLPAGVGKSRLHYDSGLSRRRVWRRRPRREGEAVWRGRAGATEQRPTRSRRPDTCKACSPIKLARAKCGIMNAFPV